MRSFICVGLASALLALSPVVQAADADPDDEYRSSADDLVLGRHFFQLPALQTSAFMTTHAGMRQSFHTFNVRDAPVTGSQSREVQALGVAATVNVGFRFLKRFEFYALGGADAFSGNSAENIIVGGAGYSYRGAVGLGFNIFRGPTTQLSLRLQGDAGKAKRILILDLLTAVTGGSRMEAIGQILDGNTGKLISTDVDRLAGTLNVDLAQSLGKAVGLQASVGLTLADMGASFYSDALGQVRDVNVTIWTPTLALAGSFDIRGVAPQVPIALMAEYALQVPYAKNRSNNRSEWLSSTNTMAFGVYYSGRRNLLLGLNFVRVLNLDTDQGVDNEGRPYPNGRPTYNSFLLSLRYTW